jgi:site-specific recombinase XerD
LGVSFDYLLAQAMLKTDTFSAPSSALKERGEKKMMKYYPLPHPFIDQIEQLPDTEVVFANEELPHVLGFLKQYAGNKSTFESYRREVERLIQWAWRVEQKSVLALKREDIESYLNFCLKPPKTWIGEERVPRFVTTEGLRKPHPKWRPFVATVSKYDHKKGLKPDKNRYQLSQKALQEIFTGLSSFYSYLALEEKIAVNPIALIKQKSKYLQRRQKQAQVMRLSERQWQFCLDTARELAQDDPKKHERTLFILSALYLLYLRISELAASERWIPQMGHFYQDSHGYWWFKTVGKGNKLRSVAVSDDMLTALKRYRKSLQLSSLPLPNESTVLLPKEKGLGPINSTRHIRRMVQYCFDKAVEKLRRSDFLIDADALEAATVHWLRHTGISDDINKRERPVAHVRDCAGHSSSAITDRYNDIELIERHRSAKEKKIESPKNPP